MRAPSGSTARKPTLAHQATLAQVTTCTYSPERLTDERADRPTLLGTSSNFGNLFPRRGVVVPEAGMAVLYLALIEAGERIFYRTAAASRGATVPHPRHRHLRRRAVHFSTSAKQA